MPANSTIADILINGAVQITDRANVMAENGKLFNFEYSSEVVDVAAPVVILFKTGSKDVKYLTTMITLGSTVSLELFSGPTVSVNGTEIVPVKYNPTVATHAPLLKIYHTPTKSEDGSSLYVRKFIGYAQGNVASGASASGSTWRTLPKNGTYLAILTAGADNTKITYSGDFYEVDA